MKIDLNKPLGKSAKSERTASKTTINLAMRETNAPTAGKMTLYIAALVLILAVVLKFGVFDQLNRISAAEAQYTAAHAQYTRLEAALAEYDEVEREYRSYSRDWMNDTESEDYIGVDRVEVLDLVERRMASAGRVESINVRGEVLVVNMSGMSLEQISQMFAGLAEEDTVSATQLTIAETQDSNAADLSFSVTIGLGSAEEGEA